MLLELDEAWLLELLALLELEIALEELMLLELTSLLDELTRLEELSSFIDEETRISLELVKALLLFKDEEESELLFSSFSEELSKLLLFDPLEQEDIKIAVIIVRIRNKGVLLIFLIKIAQIGLLII